MRQALSGGGEQWSSGFYDKTLWGFRCLDRWAAEEMTAGVLFPSPLCRGGICKMR